MKQSKLDVGYLDDSLSLIETLTATECHLAGTFSEKKDQDYLDLLIEVRKDRSKELEKITPENEGELYCIIKHLSRAVENFRELANRMTDDFDDKEASAEYLDKADKYERIIKSLIIRKGGEK